MNIPVSVFFVENENILQYITKMASLCELRTQALMTNNVSTIILLPAKP